MKELNISKILLDKRREKKVTQDEVAEYIGVSKAAVSKWEKGISYPDITLLPGLATYFHISIDELLGYEPQLPEREIQEKYREFSAMFAEQDFFQVMEEVKQLIRKYDACYPLLFAMAQLYLNNVILLTSGEEQRRVLREARTLCQRIVLECQDTHLKKDALVMEAFLYLQEGQPQEALKLLGNKIRPSLPEDQFIAYAYQMLGDSEKAMEYLQATLYSEIVEQIDCMSLYYSIAPEEKREECAARLEKYIEVFSMDELVPHKIVGFYLAQALNGMKLGQYGKVIDFLKRYADILEGHLSDFTIHGDPFFYAIDGWLGESGMNCQMPRDMRLIRQDLIKNVTENPVFQDIKENPEFQAIEKRLEAI